MFVGYLILELNGNCVCVTIVKNLGVLGIFKRPLKYMPCFFIPSEKLKIDRDFSKYNYLSLDSATVNGLDDAANFRTVRVSYSVLYFYAHKHTRLPASF